MGGRAIVGLIYRQQRRGAVIWGSVFGLFVWVSAYGYDSAYPTAKDRLDITRTLGSNSGIRSIFGPARALDTVNGFTSWRCGTLFGIIGAVWALLLATKILRGDEEAGRTDLYFAGPVSRRLGFAYQLAGLGVTWLVLFATVVSWFVCVGEFGHYWSWTAAVFFSFVACAMAALFLAVGAVTAQFASTRRAAASIAGAFLGAAFIARAIAESVAGARWLSWASPLGWTDKTHPLTGTNAAPLALIVVAVVAAVVLAVAVSSQRDLGQGVWPSRDTAAAKTALLHSPTGLALRLLRGTAIAWCVGVGLFAAIFGTVSTAVSDAFADNTAASDIFKRMGAELSAKGYIGVTFVMISALLGLTAATFIGASRAEEADGRLEYLTAGPLARRTWLATRTGIAAGALVAMACVVGLGGWLGVVASGGNIPFGDMMLAGVNVVGPGLLVLGVGTLVYGIAGRPGSAVAYGVVAWSFLVEMIGALVKLNHFILDTSIIHHLAAAPAADPRWATTAGMVAIAFVCAAAGALALQRRDVQPG